ncbi:glycosyltransferase family 2 protein [Streptomyces sp. AK010]|uniref:glycosyltransferase family 2 protein n=1 Tax=Streptomyces sp. AK010 TaxID=2723074 RepID=UPI00161CD4D6|nr:glycosyltransferase family 2 protein [Streptomyces sp. AK010]MBB6414629.1 GT2 family glycosyltransferase [Streptomyces sp. AK010]
MSIARRPAITRPLVADAGPGDSGYAAVRVVDIDLTRPYEFRPPAGPAPVRPTAPVLALVRLRGRPLGLVRAGRHQGGTPEELWRSLAATARRGFPLPRAGIPAHAPSYVQPSISVIVATHNRPGMLRECLDSLLRMGYPRFEVIVVDNAPADDAAEQLVGDVYGGRVRYVREPRAGLAHAHNRGLALARGEIAAFTDDDALADPGWLAALAEGFARGRGVVCVTGLIVPAELETAAQAALERHGGFAKGFAPRTWSLRHPPHDPLFPFTAGRFGSGTNMAFRVGPLRALGGFDPATGTGTPAHGGDDLLAFFRVLTAGHTLAYQPGAIVWHRHRRTQDALDTQAFGYGAGLGAYLTGALARDPRLIPALLRRLPRGLRYAVAQTHRKVGSGSARSRRLARLELCGLLYGPIGYLRSRRRNRTGRGPV